METDMTDTSKTMNAYHAMAWHHDPLVREIFGEIDDRPDHEIAESIREIVFGADWQWDENPDACDQHYPRQLTEPEATDRLTREQAADATTLASQIVDWANYGEAYGDYSDPPWERGQ